MKDLRDNALPLTAIVAVLAFAIAATWTGAQWKMALDANTNAVQHLADRIANTWTVQDHERWAVLLKTLNPTLTLPPTDKIPRERRG